MISKKMICFICVTFFLIASVANGENHEEEDFWQPVFADISDSENLDKAGQQRESSLTTEDFPHMNRTMRQRSMSGLTNERGNFNGFGRPKHFQKSSLNSMDNFSLRPMKIIGMNGHLQKRTGTTAILCQQVVEFAMQYQETDKENKKTDIKEKLNETLTQLFDQALLEKERDIKKLKEHIEKQEKLISKSKHQKEEIIQKRLDKITECDNELNF